MEALQESEERLKLANKATNDVIWDWDILNDTQQWNEAGKIVFGWSDIVSSPQKASWWADRIHPDDRHRVEEGFFEVVNDPENDHWQDEYKFLKADGNYVRVMDRGYVLRNEQGQALRMIGAMLDITELKEMQERLQKSEQRLASVIRTQQEMICRFLPDTTLTFVNDAFCRAVGMSEDELVGAKFIEMLPESEHDRVFENLSRTNAENPTRTYSHPAILKNRKEVWQEWTDYAILDSENNVIEYQSVGIDITEKREADRKLKESAARIKAIIDTIPDMLFVIDRDGYFREYYASDEDKLVLRPRRIVGANIRDMFDEEESKRHLRAYEHCIDSGQLQVLEYYLDLGDRRSFYEARISPLDGNTVLATIRDMTDYKQLTESLEESRRKYQLLVDNQNDLLIQFDLEGRIIFVNPEYCKTFGMSEEELKGKSFFPLICEDDHSNVKNSLKKVLSPPYTTRHEERAMTVEGWRWFSWSAKAILSEQGQVTSIISVGRDITERRQAEGEILRMNRLLESTRAAQSSYIISDDPRETFDSLLDILLSLTGSEFGFLDEVLRDENGSPYKLSLSLFNIAWSPETQELYEGLRERRLEFRNLQNLSGLPAVTGKPVIANDAPNDPRSGGLPPGHPRIHNFMGLPMYFGDKLVGVAGIANRDGGYSEEMVSFLDPFLSACASIIHATRSHSKEREFVATLKESEARYRSLAEENAVLLEKSRRDAEYKEILLHEVNHRVKNNLAAIIGLLYAQQRSIGNDMKEDFRKVMKELAHRIETLALVHNLLSSTKWNSLSLPWLFKEILQSATKIVPEGKCLKYSVSDIDARVPAQLANSLSLIIFELTTNTIKHALRDRELVNVTITNEWTPQGLLIQYRDDGPGFPDEVIKMEKVNLGLDLVRTLASHDLQGELILNNASGAVVEIRLGKDTGIKCVDDAMEKENA
jgi:PAS domain S-box-containing protein